MEKIEKELKFKIDNPETLINQLLKNGATFLNKSKERTIRFDTPKLDLERKGIFLRVREGSKKIITLKEKIGENEAVKTRKETEFEIEDIEYMRYILERLGFNYIRIFEKFRINLTYKGTTVSIDELPFGIYIEIEGEENDINLVMKELGFRDEDKIVGTYWDLFEKHKQKNNLGGEDILFPDSFQSKILTMI